MTAGAHGTYVPELLAELRYLSEAHNRHERRALATRKRLIRRAIAKQMVMALARSFVKLGREIKAFLIGRK